MVDFLNGSRLEGKRMVAKGFGKRLLVVSCVMGGFVVFGVLDYLVCAGFRLIPPDSSERQKLVIYLVASPILTTLMLLAVYCVLYPIVNLFLATITYLVNGEILTLGRVRERIKERMRARETEAYSEKKRIEAKKKIIDRDYEEAQKELDKEFPGIKEENEITWHLFEELGGKRKRRR